MKKILFLFISFFLFTGILVFADSRFSPVSIGLGLFTDFTPQKDTDEWSVNPGGMIAMRGYFKQLNEKFNLGIAFSFGTPFSSVSNINWKMPDGDEFNFNKDFASMFEFDFAFGGSLLGEINKSLFYLVDLSFLFNMTIASRKLGYYLMYGNVEQNFNITDYGVSIKPGLMFTFGKFSFEISAHLKFYFLRMYSYKLYSDYNETMLDEYKYNTSENALQFRIQPYILAGFYLP